MAAAGTDREGLAERWARDWIDYAFAWARRSCPPPLDWEQVAIDGLAKAIARNRMESILPIEHLRHHLRGERSQALAYSRRAKRAGTVPLAEGSDDEIAAVGCDPTATIAARDEAARLLGLMTDRGRRAARKLMAGEPLDQADRDALRWARGRLRGRADGASDH